MEDIFSKTNGWPGTPGLERLQRAGKRLESLTIEDERTLRNGESLDQTGLDARKLLLTEEITAFSLWGTATIEEMKREGQLKTSRDITRIALQGTSEEFIGTVLQPGAENPDPENPDPENSGHFRITKLHRDPQWAGFNPLLNLCRGLEVHIFTRGLRGRTEMVAAAPRWAEGNAAHEEPKGALQEAIRDAVLFHGATRCIRVG